MLSGSMIELERVRLPERAERVAQTASLGGMVGVFLFGFVFVAIGTLIINHVGQKIIPVYPSGVREEYWILLLVGGIFATFGMILWARVFKARLLEKRRQALVAQVPRSQAFADYPWNPKGITKSPWAPVGKSLGVTLFLAAFLTPFNWWAWRLHGGPKAIVAVFDVVLVLIVIDLVRRILVALKYGNSWIEYETFPSLTGGSVDLRWWPPSGLENATSIKFILRCVEEWNESRGTGEQRSSSLIHEQLWATTRTTEGRVDCQHNRPMSLSFDVPATAPGSNLSRKLSITFWELDVCAEAPGIDFQERYLVPVYAGAS